MKKIIHVLLVLVLIGAPFANAADKKPPQKIEPVQSFDPVPAFQQFVARAGAEKTWTRVWFNEKLSKWSKQFITIGEVTYDVKKTDSLVSPVVGLVKFNVSIKYADFYDTKEEAELVMAPSQKISMQYAVEGHYVPTASTWSLSKFKYRDIDPSSPLKNSEYTFMPERLNSEKPSAIGEVLKRWVPLA